MERKTTAKLAACLLSAALLCGSLIGCGNSEKPEEPNEDAMANAASEESATSEESAAPEDIVVHTNYGDLHYPDQWREYVTTHQEQNGDAITVTFGMKAGEKAYELFQILIGNADGAVVGNLTDDAGTKRNVYLRAEGLPADSDLGEADQTRFYAMQEDLNYLVDNLEER